jgi:predicted PurR-regulated permease PerM
MAIFDAKTARVLATILAFAASLYVLWGLRELFFLFLISIFFAYTVEPIINIINRNTPPFISRRKAIFVTYIAIFIGIVFGITILSQLIAGQAADLIKQLPSLDEDPSTALRFPLPARLEPFREQIMQHGIEFARSTANNFISNIGSVGFLLLAPIFALFFHSEGTRYRAWLIRSAARWDYHIALTALLDDLRNLLSNYIRALFIQSLSVFIGYTAYYEIAQVPYPILLATLAAALEIIPALGWISAALLSILVVLFSGYSHIFWLLIFYLVFRVFQDYVVTPLVMKKGVELPPILVLAGVIAGEMLGGVRGMFLSIPTLAAIRVFYRHWAKRSVMFLCIAASLQAHSISVSTSTATLEGQSLSIALRIPKYEAEHTTPAAIGSAMRFNNAKLTHFDCNPVDQELLCKLAYTFATPPGELIEANVTLARVTVPNHVHIMRFLRGATTRQAVFDRTFENERIDLHEVGKAELWSRAARMGFTQLLYQPILILMLLLVARPLSYLAATTAAFLILLPDTFYAIPGFFELATAISLTYLALEHLWFPNASGKWLLAAAIGALEGAGLAILARPTGPGAVAFGAGNIAASLLVILLANRFSRNISDLWLRRIMWALTGLGAIWSIWVFVKRF